MTAYQDFHPIDCFGPPPSDRRIAIGWLERGTEYSQGEVTRDFFERLKALVANRFEPVLSVGLHQCDLCQFDGPLGSGNLFVPDGERMFVCPELVVHYVDAHSYEPPTEFQEAVIRCPDPAGREYRTAFLRAGGRALLDLPAN
ncbi:MAG: hypothetical protein AAF196_18180 [Planctomycetota bacterium]